MSKESFVKRKLEIIQISILFLGCLLCIQVPTLVHAADAEFPTKPIEFINAFAVGGSNDILYRAINRAASVHLGQPIITINKPGANGAIARRAVKNAAPNGYTIGNMTNGIFLAPYEENASSGGGEVEPKDLTWIMSFGNMFYPLLVRGDAPWQNWNEFINWAKKNPGATTLGVTGTLTNDFKLIAVWWVGRQENAEFTDIAFKSNAEVLTALMGGHINLYGGTADASTMGYVRDRKLKILAFIQNKIPGYEHIPSLEDLYGFKFPNFNGVAGPKGIPVPIVKKLEDAYAKAMKDPEVIHLLNGMYVNIRYMDGATLAKYTEENFAEVPKIIEKIKAEERKSRSKK